MRHWHNYSNNVYAHAEEAIIFPDFSLGKKKTDQGLEGLKRLHNI